VGHLFCKLTGKVHLGRLKQHLLREGRLTKACALRIIQEASNLFKVEDNMLEISFPVTVCGDLHGQFFDLVRLFEVGGDPRETQYLFLGDYVDRGCFSTEVVFYLYAHKIVFQNTFFMLRGNHECRQLTSFFNFQDECKYKYDLDVYDAIMESFDHLPLGAVVNKQFFCIHGGLSPEITRIEQIRAINRHHEIPRAGAMCDLLWSDPYEPEAGGTTGMGEGERAGKTRQVIATDDPSEAVWFQSNEARQCSYLYGVEAVRTFLETNNMTAIIRAHEAQVDGYKMHMVNRTTRIPRVITVFSAPNYCDAYKNKAACIKFDVNVLNIKQFTESPHPYYLPNFMDVFRWSLPFVAEKVTDLLANVLDMNGVDEEEVKSPIARPGLLKKKVMAVTKLVRMYKILRQESENVLQLKQLSPNQKMPIGLLSRGAEGIKQALDSFESVRAADADSEQHPMPQPHKLPRYVRFGSFDSDAETASVGAPSPTPSEAPSVTASSASAATTAVAGNPTEEIERIQIDECV